MDGFNSKDEYLWPAKGLNPIVDDARDWEHNAWLPDQPDWIGYRSGYVRAADVLVDHVLERNADQDLLIYPVLFLIRHATELGLKHVIALASRVLHESVEVPAHHLLDELWRTARALIERVDPPPPPDDLEAVNEAVAQLSELDGGSFTFRYPYEQDQKTPSFNLDNGPLRRLINIRALKEWADRLEHFLDGNIEMLLVYLEYEADMASEYGP